MVKFRTRKQTLQCTLVCQISSGSFFSCQQKSQILQHYQFRHPVVAPSSNVETKLNVGAQLQTFPIQRYQKSRLSSNGFLAKSFSQTLPFKSVKDKQTKQKTTVLVPRRHAKSEPYQTWHGDRGPWARSCISKTHSFAATEHLKFGSYHTHRCSVSPLQVEKPQNCPLMFRAVLVVTNKTQHFSHPRQGA